MPRPRKHRRVCSRPKCISFSPCQSSETSFTMTIDEYEAIRLIDLEGLTQAQCADQMHVARTTIQAIYASARKTLAKCIVEGCHLHIDGGDVHYCEHYDDACGSGCCCEKRRCCENRKDATEQ
ncbi:DUF134 domain-containing protein [Ruminococcaceae bacterium OttesenSCG-928-L11]|nr:DUF134 domain-containing protein [Ruminococcaceae bacterium OttesenSCG-928-L11]